MQALPEAVEVQGLLLQTQLWISGKTLFVLHLTGMSAGCSTPCMQALLSTHANIQQQHRHTPRPASPDCRTLILHSCSNDIHKLPYACQTITIPHALPHAHRRFLDLFFLFTPGGSLPRGNLLMPPPARGVPSSSPPLAPAWLSRAWMSASGKGHKKASSLVHSPTRALHTTPYHSSWGQCSSHAATACNSHLKRHCRVMEQLHVEAGMATGHTHAQRSMPTASWRSGRAAAGPAEPPAGSAPGSSPRHR